MRWQRSTLTRSPRKWRNLASQNPPELTERFGGVTAYTRTPAEGRWKPDAQPASAEDIVVLEVMVDELQAAWWHRYRKSLERSFRQKHIVIRAQEIVLL